MNTTRTIHWLYWHWRLTFNDSIWSCSWIWTSHKFNYFL